MNALLQDIWGQDFSKISNADVFCQHFFKKNLSIPELKIISEAIRKSSVTLGEKHIAGAVLIQGKQQNEVAPFAVLAQLHGNEPAGLAGIALAMALSQSGLLEHDVIGVVGNTLAAEQYFSAYDAQPDARQETRDAFRCGLGEAGELLPDLNRIPVDFRTRKAVDHHTRRAQELYRIGEHISGILDIHSARGNMTCITDHKRDSDLQFSPIRALLTDLAEAISANASATVSVQTLKTILFPLPNIVCQTGIEAGRHEDPRAPRVAAEFTLATFYRLGITHVPPIHAKDDGVFEGYSVQPRITFADLMCDGVLQREDKVYMAREHDGRIEEYQIDEMEAVKKGQVVAVAKPSGVLFRAPFDFSGIFFSKAGALYDKDPAVGPWPVAADQLAHVKFCYPCKVSNITLDFGD